MPVRRGMRGAGAGGAQAPARDGRETPVTPYQAIAYVNEEAADVLNLLDALRAIGAKDPDCVDGIRAYKARRWHARVFGEALPEEE